MKAKRNDTTKFPNFDFLALFTRLLKSCLLVIVTCSTVHWMIYRSTDKCHNSPILKSCKLFFRNQMIYLNETVNGLANHYICTSPAVGIIKQSEIFADIVVTSHELGHT